MFKKNIDGKDRRMVAFKCPRCWENPVTQKYARFCEECRGKCSKCRKNPRRAPNDSYCKGCRNAAINQRNTARGHRRKTPTQFSADRTRARSYLSSLISRGKIVRPDCCSHEGCAATLPIAYFEDVKKPREMIWLCRQHAAERGFIRMPAYPSWLGGAPSTPARQARDANPGDRIEQPPQS